MKGINYFFHSYVLDQAPSIYIYIYIYVYIYVYTITVFINALAKIRRTWYAEQPVRFLHHVQVKADVPAWIVGGDPAGPSHHSLRPPPPPHTPTAVAYHEQSHYC